MTRNFESFLAVIMVIFTAIGVLAFCMSVREEFRDGKVTNYCDTGKQNRIYVYEDKFQVVYDPTCETE